jgi:quercetin dioxygenase-like cupin family protein
MTKANEDVAARKIESAGHVRQADPQLTGEAMPFDLHHEVREMRLEDTWARTGQNAKTLVKYSDFRVVLIVMRTGAHIREHETDARVSIQCLSGRLRLSLPDRTVVLSPGRLLVLDRSVLHEVEALDESALLLSISWPRGAASRE